MESLQYWQEKIQERRKKTGFRDFLLEVGSWVPLNFYKTPAGISRYPQTDRIWKVTSSTLFFEEVEKSELRNVTWDFFADYASLFKEVSLPLLLEADTENAEYADNVWFVKNVYLSFAVVLSCENVMYSVHIKEWCKNVFNSLMVRDHSENVYNSKSVIKSSNIYYSAFMYNCIDVRYSTNLLGCSHCIDCTWLENQSYCINNKQYTKEEFDLYKKSMLLEGRMKDAIPDAVWQKINSTECIDSGFCVNSHGIQNGNNVYNVRNWRNLYDVWSSWWNEHVYDSIIAWSPHGSHFYATLYSGPWEHIYCCEGVAWWQNNYYSYMLIDCSFCIGCIWLKNKSYCILNKQYSKEERYSKMEEIFTAIDEKWQTGAFFLSTLNPYYFNDTAAYLIDPSFTKEEVTKLWYLWRDEPIKVDIPDRMEIVKTTDLSQYESYKDWQRTIDPSILKKVIIDEEGNSYRVVKLEYDFLVKHGLPLPRKHWLERMKDNFRL
jgi:hypothetical protein